MRPQVSNNLRIAARAAGLSLLEIARETGVSYSMLRRIASGRGDVCLGDAVAVSFAVGQPVDRLFALHRDAPEPPRSVASAGAEQCTLARLHADYEVMS